MNPHSHRDQMLLWLVKDPCRSFNALSSLLTRLVSAGWGGGEEGGASFFNLFCHFEILRTASAQGLRKQEVTVGLAALGS